MTRPKNPGMDNLSVSSKGSFDSIGITSVKGLMTKIKTAQQPQTHSTVQCVQVSIDEKSVSPQKQPQFSNRLSLKLGPPQQTAIKKLASPKAVSRPAKKQLLTKVQPALAGSSKKVKPKVVTKKGTPAGRQGGFTLLTMNTSVDHKGS